MRKIDDSRLYFYFSIITLFIGVLLGFTAYYSKFIVEPQARELLSSRENVSEHFRKAYAMLRDPQIFARYENFDIIAQPIKNIIRDYDKKIHEGEEFTEDDGVYLEILLERRILGSDLTRNTMIFFILLSFLGWIFFLYEKVQLRRGT